nr:zinc finger, CCHC-type, retrotransposon Gag domain protein [Tanacetum cinerariifolium]
MVTTRNNPNDNVRNFEAMINAAVANALPNLTAALRTQITIVIRNGAGPSGGGGGDAIPHGIHVWIERLEEMLLPILVLGLLFVRSFTTVAAAARNIELLHESGNSNKRDIYGNRVQNRGHGQQEIRGRYDQG